MINWFYRFDYWSKYSAFTLTHTHSHTLCDNLQFKFAKLIVIFLSLFLNNIFAYCCFCFSAFRGYFYDDGFNCTFALRTLCLTLFCSTLVPLILYSITRFWGFLPVFNLICLLNWFKSKLIKFIVHSAFSTLLLQLLLSFWFYIYSIFRFVFDD